jgi:hypothetical protein
MQDVKERLLQLGSYSAELGLQLERQEDRFKWFLASILFGKRISAGIAVSTYRVFEDRGLVTPDRIIAAGWDELVEVLDAGGYVRYDFSTASNLLDLMRQLLEEYGSLEALHSQAKDSRDLEKRLVGLKAVGPTTANIFLRELRGIWPKADPAPSHLATGIASRLGLRNRELAHPWLESALVKVELRFCKRRKCDICPVRDWCRESGTASTP